METPSSAVGCRAVTDSLLSDPKLFSGKQEHIMPVLLAVVRRMGQFCALDMCGQDEDVHLPAHCSGCDECFGWKFWKSKTVVALFEQVCKCKTQHVLVWTYLVDASQVLHQLDVLHTSLLSRSLLLQTPMLNQISVQRRHLTRNAHQGIVLCHACIHHPVTVMKAAGISFLKI